MNEVQEISHHL